ncbi:MAG: hypothetical protein CL920_25715 [Deltaproteobacteria bacterium]|nr:hypothetical protein [Deltaproteobacteria bacterium]MBU52105.1 hypothetical protein [Deltaproteobacteria bacterium]
MDAQTAPKTIAYIHTHPIPEDALTDVIWRRGYAPQNAINGLPTTCHALCIVLSDNPSDQTALESLVNSAKEQGIAFLTYIPQPPCSPFNSAAERVKKHKLQAPALQELYELAQPFKTQEEFVSTLFKDLLALEYTPSWEADQPNRQLLHHPETERLPIAPTPYIAHPYILTKTFVGRREELQLLHQWADSNDPMMIVDGIGGLGKSALTWEWFTQYAQKDINALAGVIWWSFYESNATIGHLIYQALRYMRQHTEEEIHSMSFKHRQAALIEGLRKQPYLLVLDGIERIMVAYHRLDAPQLRDEQVSTGETISEQERMRQFTDPRHGEFLKDLLACTPSKILISTRLKPKDLEDKDNSLLQGVRYIALNHLSPDDAMELLHIQGVKEDSASMRSLLKKLDYHGLLMGTVAGHFRHVEDVSGTLAALEETLDWQHESGPERRIRWLEYIMQQLPDKAKQLLCQLAAFRYPVHHEGIRALNPDAPKPPHPIRPPDESWLEELRNDLENADDDADREEILEDIEYEEQELTEAYAEYAQYKNELREHYTSDEYAQAQTTFHKTLCELESRGLLQWDRPANRYDLHPVIRGYAYEQLDPNIRESTFEKIRDHFERLPPKKEEDIQDLSDLRRRLEIYHALIGAGQYDDASYFYGHQLADPLYQRLSAYHAIIEVLTPLFVNGLDAPPALSSESQQSYRITSLANAVSMVGRNDDARKMRALSIKMDLEARNASSLSISLVNYSLSLQSDDQLEAAWRCMELARRYAEFGSSHSRLSALMFQAMYASGLGRWKIVDENIELFESLNRTSPRAIIETRMALVQAKSYIARDLPTEEALDRAMKLAQEHHYSSGICRNYNTRAGYLFAQGKIDEAKEAIKEAITMAKKMGSINIILYLAFLAEIHIKEGAIEEAERLLQEAAGLDERYTTFFTSSALLAFAKGEREKGIQFLDKAYKEAWAEGEPYSWVNDLKDVRTFYKEHDVPEPTLPAYDPTKRHELPVEAALLEWLEELESEAD